MSPEKSYDVLFTAGEQEILRIYETLNAGILFGAEVNCSPDPTLCPLYPEVDNGYKYINSGVFIGYAPYIYDIVSDYQMESHSDQVFYSAVFLNETLRLKYNIKLDITANLIQNLYWTKDDVMLVRHGSDIRVVNTRFGTKPVILHANGSSKMVLHRISDYVVRSWSPVEGCLSCRENNIHLGEKSDDEYPHVLVGVFIERPTPFLEEFLEQITGLIYPKSQMSVFLSNQIDQHEDIIQLFISKYGGSYRKFWFLPSSSEVDDTYGRNLALEKCLNVSCDVYFNLDSSIYIENPRILYHLISYNRTILEADLEQQNIRNFSMKCDYWLLDDANNIHFEDSLAIKNITTRGIWTVPQISGAYVIWNSVLKNEKFRPDFSYFNTAPDRLLSESICLKSKASIFMRTVNLEHYGFMKAMDDVRAEYLHSDMWQASSNPRAWQRKYLHPKYHEYLILKKFRVKSCPEKVSFPFVSERFSKDLVEIIRNHYRRLHQPYGTSTSTEENCVVNFLNFRDLNFDNDWAHILKTYLKPWFERLKLPANKRNSVESVISVVFSLREKKSYPLFVDLLQNSTAVVKIMLAKVPGSCMRLFPESNCFPDPGWGTISARLTHQ